MRKINRLPNSTPNCLTAPPKKKKATASTRQEEVTQMWVEKVSNYMSQKPEKKKEPNFGWYELRSAIIEALLNLTDNHCSFCDCWFNSDQAAHSTEIEHFKPKIKYPESAFDWFNLFVICRACNKIKGQEYKDLLLKPDNDKFSHDYFAYNVVTGEIYPNPGKDKEVQDAVEYTIKTYKLDRPELRKARKDALEHYNGNRDSLIRESYRDFIERFYTNVENTPNNHY